MILSCVKMVISIRKEKTVSSENFEKNKKSQKQLKKAFGVVCGAPEGIRIPDLPLRRRTLYPAELRAHILFYRLWRRFGNTLGSF